MAQRGWPSSGKMRAIAVEDCPGVFADHGEDLVPAL